MDTEDPIQRPSLFLSLTEPVRAAADFATLLPGACALSQAPRGDGHRVIVLPGFTASDGSTAPLRSFLRNRGFDARGWKLGRNTAGPELRPGLLALLEQAVDESGGPVSLVGWSLGGVMARNLARRTPELVRYLVTLGSPINGRPDRTRAWQLYSRMNSDAESRGRARRSGHRPPPEGVPCTAIYSRSDGVVPWQIARERAGDRRENVRVRASHLGMGVHAGVLYAVADRLAQPRDEWRPFEAPWWLRGSMQGEPA
jgi:pimeloyl-ACP methyl ester carboxylesterase